MKRYFAIWCILLSLLPAAAQSLQMYGYRIKGISEFMARFNGEEHTNLVDPNAPDFDRMHLFHVIDANIEPFSGDIREDIKQFTDSIIQNDIQLSFSSTAWIAEAQAEITYKAKSYPVTLYLQTEEFEQEMYKWAIVGVNGVYEHLLNGTAAGAISPTENEVEFIELESIFQYDIKNIAGYRASYIDLDPLTAFFALAEAGVIKWNGVDKVRYHFLEVPGFIFTVDYFFRDGSNAGWLISGIKPATLTDKQEYYSKMRGLIKYPR